MSGKLTARLAGAAVLLLAVAGCAKKEEPIAPPSAEAMKVIDAEKSGPKPQADAPTPGTAEKAAGGGGMEEPRKAP
ncbi:MAG: hypothetical protein IT204_22930 [Fimbriimonadaceae bacterium]|nr:hypothetical protein [Fimbriimonadaceae bacterium]